MDKQNYLKTLESFKYPLPCVDQAKGFNKGIDIAILLASKLDEPEKSELIEEEKRYTAKLKISGEYLRVTSDGSIGHFKVDRQYIIEWATAYQFTESQLRDYDIWEDDTYDIEEVIK